MFVLSEKAYQFLKNLVQIVLPGLGTLYFSIAEIWGLPAGEKVVATLSAIAVFLGIILKISSSTFEKLGKAFDGDFVVEDGEDGMSFRLALDTGPEELALKDRITFRKVAERDRPLVADDVA